MSWLAGALMGIGLLVALLAVAGLLRLGDVYLRVHAASKASALGVVLILVASVATADGSIITRALLVAVFLVLAAPASSHAVASAAYRNGARLEARSEHDASDEEANR